MGTVSPKHLCVCVCVCVCVGRAVGGSRSKQCLDWFSTIMAAVCYRHDAKCFQHIFSFNQHNFVRKVVGNIGPLVHASAINLLVKRKKFYDHITKVFSTYVVTGRF